MDNSIYVALSRQLGLMRKMDMTANNIANADTVGFHAEKMVFTDYLVKDGQKNRVAFSQDISSYRVEETGPMNVTGGQYDVAISGPGFFSVQTPQGALYTRAGNFQRNLEGVLVNSEGFPVLTQGGQQIIIDEQVQNVVFTENGIIRSSEGQELGQIAISEFTDPQELVRVNSQMFRTDQTPLVAVQSRVLHGVLEGSNVSAVQELVETTKLSRSTSSTAKFIEVMYDLQRKTSNAYARQSPK